MDARQATNVFDEFAYSSRTLLQFDWSYSRYLDQSIYFSFYSNVILGLKFIQVVKSDIQNLIPKIALFHIDFQFEATFDSNGVCQRWWPRKAY